MLPRLMLIMAEAGHPTTWQDVVMFLGFIAGMCFLYWVMN